MTIVPGLMQSYEATSKLVAAEETLPPVARYEDWQVRQQSRAELVEHLAQVEQAVASLRRRIAALPTLPPAAYVHWAQAVLALPNLAFLEVDTDGLSADADILRIALVDQQGTVLYDQVFASRRPLSPRSMHLTGLTPEMLTHTPSLAEVWRSSEFLAAFVGRYLLSFNLAFDSGKLAESSARYHLPPLPFVGECLMLRAQEYYGAASYPKLADLCERLGAPLPPHPEQDALDRARGQVHLLRAMAQGITSASTAHQISDEGESSDAGDPFLPDFPDEDD